MKTSLSKRQGPDTDDLADSEKSKMPGKDRLDKLLARIRDAGISIIIVWLLIVAIAELPARMMVEAVAVPSDVSASGISNVAAQRVLVTSLQTVMTDARKTMPGEITDQIQAVDPEISIDVPGTQISLQSIVQQTKRLLWRNDINVRSTMFARDSGYSVHVHVTGATSDLSSETTPPTSPFGALDVAALEVMKVHNAFYYASALASRARERCYEQHVCDYPNAINAFEAVLKDDTYNRYHRWSWLALSKIDEDQGRYFDEATKAMLAVHDRRRFFWAFYNWGVALSEQGCSEQALEAFEIALRVHPNSDFVNNAAGRELLILAASDRPDDLDARMKDLQRAVAFLIDAVEAKPDYAEAYVNLARALALLARYRRDMPMDRQGLLPDPGEPWNALNAVLLADSPQVQRASRLVESWGPETFRVADVRRERFGPMVRELIEVHGNIGVCSNTNLADSIRESKGCWSDDDKLLDDPQANTYLPRHDALKHRPSERVCEDQSVRQTIRDIAWLPKRHASVHRQTATTLVTGIPGR
jgi:tetratricopeptide (TPR) repeat protein